MKTLNKNSVAMTVGAAVIGASSLVAATSANANPFEVMTMQSGYMLDAGEGKCGEGKCGGDKKAKKEGKCGEGKCGEGKCGGDKKTKKEGKCGEGKCGGHK